MIRIIESISSDQNKMKLKLKENDSIEVDENLIDDWLNITLAGLDDNIIYDNVDLSTPSMITFEYYYNIGDMNPIYLGQWDINYEDMINMSEKERINLLDNISAEVEAAVSGMKRSEYVDDSGIDGRTGRKAGVPADFDGEDDEWDIENNKPFDSYYKESSSNIKENWQDDWVEPTIDPNPIDNINGLNIYKGTNQYGEKAYYLFLEDEDPEPGYEEWQAETLEIVREWASSYELAEADDFDEFN